MNTMHFAPADENIAHLAMSHLSHPVSATDTDEQIAADAEQALAFVEEMEDEAREEHLRYIAEDGAWSGHGSEFDPCGICRPYDRGSALAVMIAEMQAQRFAAA